MCWFITVVRYRHICVSFLPFPSVEIDLIPHSTVSMERSHPDHAKKDIAEEAEVPQKADQT